MGMCKPSGGVTPIYGPYRHSLPSTNTPNSRIDYYDEITKKLLQQRWYDSEGKAIWNRDWDHNDYYDEHVFPHDHRWDYSKKKPRQKPEKEINKNYY